MTATPQPQDDTATGRPRRHLGRPFGLVTGASSGIGLELARELADRDHDLLLVAGDDQVHDVAKELGAITCSYALQADLATPEGVDEIIEALDADGRRPSVAVLNAGSGVGEPVGTAGAETLLRAVALNVTATVLLGQAVARRMVAQGDGRLMLTSAAAPDQVDVAGSTALSFVRSFSDAIRAEVEGSGVSVTTLLAGPTETVSFDRAGPQDAPGSHDDLEDVARAAVDALFEGEAHVVPGSRRSVRRTVSALVPEPVRATMERVGSIGR